MENLRIYGDYPLRLVVLHGGPGAGGEIAPVARELARVEGVLEPRQTATTIRGQVAELHSVLANKADLPVVLIGWSWGAILGYIFTAHHPELVARLIMIASGPFTAEYAADIMPVRMDRLTATTRTEVEALLDSLDDPACTDKNKKLLRFGEIMMQADSYDPLPLATEITSVRYDIYRAISEEFTKLRSSGDLLNLGRKIICPVVAIHGDYDPHPYQGVAGPLSGVIRDFRLIRLRQCGHQPWRERTARDRFYKLLRSEIAEARLSSRNTADCEKGNGLLC